MYLVTSSDAAALNVRGTRHGRHLFQLVPRKCTRPFASECELFPRRELGASRLYDREKPSGLLASLGTFGWEVGEPAAVGDGVAWFFITE